MSPRWPTLPDMTKKISLDHTTGDLETYFLCVMSRIRNNSVVFLGCHEFITSVVSKVLKYIVEFTQALCRKTKTKPIGKAMFFLAENYVFMYKKVGHALVL
jgi:hypothetical protein